MAKVKKCQVCKKNMRVKSEQKEPAGSWIVYECKNDACKNYIMSGKQYRFNEKVFEGARQ